MITFIWSLFSFLIAITLIIVVHEFGHFWVARIFNIKVLRFSIGFGKPLWKRIDKTGMEFVLAAIPLGGYVKMLDEREGEVKPEDLAYTFNRKPLWIRTLVVIAGPLFNLIFALLIYWIVLLMGTNIVMPKIGKVIPGSVAAQAHVPQNSIIKEIDNHPIKDWRDVLLRLTESVSSTGQLTLTTYSPENKTTQIFLLDKKNWHLNEINPDPLSSLGLEPFLPSIPPIIFKVVPDSPAAKIGLQVNDKIISVANKKVNDWREMQTMVFKNIEKTIPIDILRDKKIFHLQITPERKVIQHKTIGYLGIQSKPMSYPKELIYTLRYNPISAIIPAFEQTIFISKLTFKLLIKLVTGHLSVKTLSGPIGIAEGAGNAASLGIANFLDFIALLSISVGILNILPIPLLDGGHLLYFVVEFVTGRPLSEKVQEIGLRIGILILVSLTFFAFYNDLSRLFT